MGQPATDSRSALATMVVRAAETAGVTLHITDNGLTWT
jgi:hypothetical protein